MPSTRDIVYGLYGAWRLARVDRGAMSYFDDSIEGFWKSFFAAVLVAPGYIILIALEPEALETDSGALRLILIHFLTYTMSWTVYPVVVHPICQVMDRDAAYVRFIVAFNWAKVIQMAAYVPVVVIVWLGILPDGLASLLNGVIYVALLAYQWFVTRTALDIQPWPATGLVVVDFIISVILSVLTVGMLR